MKKGVVFEGGGAKGAYQIGAVKALEELGFEFDAVAGTSVGALNGVAVAQNEIQRAYEIWETVEPEKIFNMDALVEAKNDKKMFIKLLKKIIEDRGLDTEPLTKIISDFVDEEKIRKRNIIFGLVTYSINDMKPIEVYLEDIPNGKLKEYIIASANFPLFKAMKIDGKTYSDGGLYNNYPINLLINKGVKEIVSVRTFGIGVIRKFDLKDTQILRIEPKEKLGPILDFSKERINKNLKLGYYDAYRAVKGYHGEKYYLDMDFSEDDLCSRMFCIKKEKLKQFSKKMGDGDSDPMRYFFETLIPKAAEYIGLDENAGYSRIITALLEVLAEEKNIERFKTYTYSKFLELLHDEYKDEKPKNENLSMIEELLTKKDLIPKNTKKRILKEIALLVLEDMKFNA